MLHIALISASVRTDRKSHHVALHLKRSIEATDHTVDLLDLKEFDFPLFEERLKFMKEPTAKILDFAERLRKADGVIIVTPEYNGSFPASLKNVIDLLTEDWKGKPVSLCTVSGGMFAGTQVMVELLFPLWKIKAWVLPSSMQVPKVQDAFGEDGSVLADEEGWKRRTDVFLKDLGWAIEARKRMEGVS
ncbi:MAG: NAD(P)H-dependent oxidoreductase [Flavobacteriales bacterium]|nr:NAD(P)H-dependent oxidoreductase [Flavobacteriales bacterium]MBK7620308.1 NAD(P)H-dependent oxidoreductase [Flavobacteriales bacterium]